MDDIQSFTNELNAFRDERHREQFHNAKDLALSISIKAAELKKCFMEKFRASKY
jgi:hypothetical protein